MGNFVEEAVECERERELLSRLLGVEGRLNGLITLTFKSLIT